MKDCRLCNGETITIPKKGLAKELCTSCLAQVVDKMFCAMAVEIVNS